MCITPRQTLLLILSSLSLNCVCPDLNERKEKFLPSIAKFIINHLAV